MFYDKLSQVIVQLQVALASARFPQTLNLTHCKVAFHSSLSPEDSPELTPAVGSQWSLVQKKRK